MPVPTHGGPDWLPLFQLMLDSFTAGLAVNIQACTPTIVVEIPDTNPIINVQVPATAPNVPVSIENVIANVPVDIQATGANLPVSIDTITVDVPVTAPVATPVSVNTQSQAFDSVASVQTADGKGRVIWMDSWECGTGNWTYTTGANIIIWATRKSRRTGMQSLAALFTATAKTLTAEKRIALPVVTKMGVEISFALGDTAATVTLRAYCVIASVIYTYDIKYVCNTGAVSYLGSDNAYHALFSIGELLGNNYYNTIKMTFDKTIGKYIEVNVNGVVTACDFACYSNATTNLSYLRLEWLLYIPAGGLANKTHFIDDFILSEE